MLNQDFKEAYNQFYINNDNEWRLMSAKAKAAHIFEVCKNLKPKKVLEVGAGDGSILHFLNEAHFGEELYAVEIAESGVDQIRNRNLERLVDVQQFDGYTLPFPDKSFDLIVLSHVLEHVEHERILLRELKRVANYIVIEVPKDYRYGVDHRMAHFLNYGHINMYTPTLLRFLLKSESLEVVKDMTSLTDPKTVEYNIYVNLKQPKSLFKTAKIQLEYWVKKVFGEILGKKKQEQYANAYTVLVKSSDHEVSIF